MGSEIYRGASNRRARHSGTFDWPVETAAYMPVGTAHLSPEAAAELAVLARHEAVIAVITDYIVAGKPFGHAMAAEILETRAPELLAMSKEVQFRVLIVAELEGVSAADTASYAAKAALDVIMNSELG